MGYVGFNEDYISNLQTTRVLTDELKTKALGWDAVTGLGEIWRQYYIRLINGKSTYIQRGGVVSYIELCIFELKHFIEDFKNEIIAAGFDYQRYKQIANIPPSINKSLMYEDDDFYFLIDFFNGFLKICGWKNVIRKGEDQSPAVIKKYNEER